MTGNAIHAPNKVRILMLGCDFGTALQSTRMRQLYKLSNCHIIFLSSHQTFLSSVLFLATLLIKLKKVLMKLVIFSKGS